MCLLKRDYGGYISRTFENLMNKKPIQIIPNLTHHASSCNIQYSESKGLKLNFEKPYILKCQQIRLRSVRP